MEANDILKIIQDTICLVSLSVYRGDDFILAVSNAVQLGDDYAIQPISTKKKYHWIGGCMMLQVYE